MIIDFSIDPRPSRKSHPWFTANIDVNPFRRIQVSGQQ
jgi:hypothetical protein